MTTKDYSKYHPWKMLFYLFMMQLLIAFAARSIAPLGLEIGTDLQLTMAQIGILPSALFLGQSLISMPAGILTDRIGSRKMMLFIALCLGLSFIFMSFTKSLVFILIFILFAGFAYGASHPATNHGVNEWFSANERGTAMGIKQMGVTAGSSLAALLLLPVASRFSWQVSILIAAFSLLIIGLIIYFFYEEQNKLHANKRRPFHVIRLFTDRGLMLVTISATLLMASQTILNTFIVIFAHEYLQISLFLSGVLLGIAEFGGSLGRFGWGIISDKLFSGGRITVLLIISALVAIMAMCMSLLPSQTPFYLIAMIVFIFGFGTSGFNGVWMNATSELVSPSLSGAATGASITISSWGAILFPPVFGFFIDWTGSYAVGWLFVTGLMIISIFSLYFIGKS